MAQPVMASVFEGPGNIANNIDGGLRKAMQAPSAPGTTDARITLDWQTYQVLHQLLLDGSGAPGLTRDRLRVYVVRGALLDPARAVPRAQQLARPEQWTASFGGLPRRAHHTGEHAFRCRRPRDAAHVPGAGGCVACRGQAPVRQRIGAGCVWWNGKGGAGQGHAGVSGVGGSA